MTIESQRSLNQPPKKTGIMWEIYDILMNAYEFNIIGKENLTSVKNDGVRSLRERDLPLTVVDSFRHSAGDDPWLTFAVMRFYFGDVLGKIILPVSDHHSNVTKFPAYAALVGVAEKLPGVKMVKITQPYRTRDLSLNEAQKTEINKQSINTGMNFLRILSEEFETGASELIAPESHRTPYLLPAEKGIGASVKTLDKKGLPAKILSTAIVYPEGYSRTLNFNPFKKTPVTMYVDKPLNPGEVIEETRKFATDNGLNVDGNDFISLMSHYLMTRMRKMLPEDQWGVYNPNNQELFYRVIRDEIKLGIWPDGKTIGLIDTVSNKPFDFPTK